MALQSTPDPVQSTLRTASRAGYGGYGLEVWKTTVVKAGVSSAGVLLVLLSTLNVIEGIAAIGNLHFFVNNTHCIAGSLNTWGWIVLWIGVIEFLVGFGVFLKSQFSRWATYASLITATQRATRRHNGRPGSRGTGGGPRSSVRCWRGTPGWPLNVAIAACATVPS